MKKIALALLLVSAVAHAQALHGSSLRLIPQLSAPSNLSGKTGIWYDSSAAQFKMHHSDGTDVPFSGGAPALISSTTPQQAVVGDSLSVIGSGFSSLSAGDVTINGTTATFTAASDTLMTVTVPSTQSGSIQVGSAVGDTINVFDPTKFALTFNTAPPDPRLYTSVTGVTYPSPPAEIANIITQGGAPWNEPNSLDWTVRFTWEPGLTDGYLVYATIGGLQYSIRTTTNATTIISNSAGVDDVSVPIMGIAPGQEVEYRYIYDTHAGADHITRIRVNGAEYIPPGQGGPGAQTMSATSVYFGSNNGATAFGGKVNYFSANTSLDHLPSPEIIVFGDSTTAGANAAWTAAPTQIYTPQERWTRAGIYSFAIGGSTIETQKTVVDALSTYCHTTNIKAVIIRLGINDLTVPTAPATVIASLQAFVTDVISKTPAGTKIILGEILPTTATASANLDAVNQAIMGGGATPITGVDVRMNAAFNALNDGTENLKLWYQQGDNEHPNNAARMGIIAGAMRAALRTAGVLP